MWKAAVSDQSSIPTLCWSFDSNFAADCFFEVHFKQKTSEWSAAHHSKALPCHYETLQSFGVRLASITKNATHLQNATCAQGMCSIPSDLLRVQNLWMHARPLLSKLNTQGTGFHSTWNWSLPNWPQTDCWQLCMGYFMGNVELNPESSVHPGWVHYCRPALAIQEVKSSWIGLNVSHEVAHARYYTWLRALSMMVQLSRSAAPFT